MMGGKPAVEARVGLFPPASGGLHGPMPSGTRSLLLTFASLEGQSEDVKIGAVIDVVDGPALIPGAGEVPVIIRFWADEAAIYATPGAAFTLWYGRPVGIGMVTRVADEVGSA